jgi:hypothetical protein
MRRATKGRELMVAPRGQRQQLTSGWRTMIVRQEEAYIFYVDIITSCARWKDAWTWTVGGR